MIRHVAAAGLCVLLAHTAAAQDFPARPITIVVPYQAGGTTDVIARAVSVKLTQTLGQPVVVENRPGANGNIGADLVAKSKPDGHTLLLTPPGPLSINRWLYAAMPFAPGDLAPVTLATTVPNILVVHPSMPAETVKDLIALARAKPGELSFGSAGSGSTSHLTGELLKTMAGIDMLHVPYKGAAPAMNDLLAGQVQMLFDNFPTGYAQVRAGKLRALAVTSPARYATAPDIPALAETVPGYVAVGWFGFAAAGPTPRPLVERLATELGTALRADEVAPRLRDVGMAVAADGPDSFAAFIADEAQKWKRVVEQSGAKAD